MRSRTAAALLPLVAALLVACGGDPPPSKPGQPGPGAGGGGGGGGAPIKLGKKMPPFTPSGMKEEFKRWQELDSAVRNSTKNDEKDAAQKAHDEWLKEFPARWEGKDVPAPECLMYSTLLQKCRLYPMAVAQVRRWIDVAPEDSVNFANAHLVLISCLALSGEFGQAETELKNILETVFKGKDNDRRAAEETLAAALLKAGKIEESAGYYEKLAVAGVGDVNNAVVCVENYLRAGKAGEAQRVAARVLELTGKEGRQGERANQLVKQVNLVGKPAPSFAAAKWWKGSGGPVSEENFKGKVTLVYGWNMKSNLIGWFEQRLLKMAGEINNPNFQIIGVSRLARFDPTKMATKKEMTDEEELTFYDLWAQQHGLNHPLAVGGYEEDALIDAWAAYVVPYYVLVGKDGMVFSVGFGKDEERFGILKGILEKALAQ
jgi:tetratricopeptide (TPR) repeat protein